MLFRSRHVEEREGPKLEDATIVVSGGTVSTENERVAGVGSTLPAWSIARTAKVWAPSASAVVGVLVAPGPLQGAKTAESKRHSYVAGVWLEENPKVGVESLVGPEGPELIVVSGGVESST